MTEVEYKMPEAAELPQPPADLDREAAMRAAMFYDRAKQERDEFMRLLEQSKVAIQVLENRIATLELTLSTERNRFNELHNTYNEALQDKADLEAILATQRDHHEDQAARLAKFEFSRLRRKRAAKRNGNSDTVSDNAGSPVEVAIGEAVLAHTKPMLGSTPEGC